MTDNAVNSQAPRLALTGVTKHFGAVRALTDISFAVHPGEIHALVGENGAGKSTLVGIITGLLEPTEGAVVIDGESVDYRNPREARAAGVTAVYQDPRLFPDLDVAENIFTGSYPRRGWGTIDRSAMHRQSAELLAQVGVTMDTHALVSTLSIAEAQFVEIARALAVRSKLLILDEPTASLTPMETETLFRVVRGLRDLGTSIIWISHRMEEIRALADSVTVLRDGGHVLTTSISEITDKQIVRAMVGREMSVIFSRERTGMGDEVVLKVAGLGQEGEFAGIDLQVRAGEIIGIGGIVGAGRTEIVEAICGIRRPTAGTVELNGRPIHLRGARDMLRHGVAYIPENRDAAGLITAMPIDRNITLPSTTRLSRVGFVVRRIESGFADTQIQRLAIKVGRPTDSVSSLSGGNRQKVALARWLATGPRLLILDEPTHGIDVGTKTEVHRIIHQLARDGIAVIIVSSDLPELLALSDTIEVIAAGRLTQSIPADEATQELVMAAGTRGPSVQGAA